MLLITTMTSSQVLLSSSTSSRWFSSRSSNKSSRIKLVVRVVLETPPQVSVLTRIRRFLPVATPWLLQWIETRCRLLLQLTRRFISTFPTNSKCLLPVMGTLKGIRSIISSKMQRQPSRRFSKTSPLRKMSSPHPAQTNSSSWTKEVKKRRLSQRSLNSPSNRPKQTQRSPQVLTRRIQPNQTSRLTQLPT